MVTAILQYMGSGRGKTHRAQTAYMDYLIAPDELDLEVVGLLRGYTLHIEKEHKMCSCPVKTCGETIMTRLIIWKATQRDELLKNWTCDDISDYFQMYSGYLTDNEEMKLRLGSEEYYGAMFDAYTCVKDFIFFLADNGALTGDGDMVIATLLDEFLYDAYAKSYGKSSGKGVSPQHLNSHH